MGTPVIYINEYGNGLTGHINVTFDDGNGYVVTYGKNLAANEGITGQAFLAGGVYNEDNIYNNSGNLVGFSAIYPTAAQFNSALNYAENQTNQTILGNGNYNLFNDNCVGFAESVLVAAGVSDTNISDYIVNPEGVSTYAGALDFFRATGLINSNATTLQTNDGGSTFTLYPSGSTTSIGTISQSGSGTSTVYNISTSGSGNQNAQSGSVNASGQLTSGSFDTSGANLGVASGASVSLSGGLDTATLAANSTLGLNGGSNYTIDGTTGTTINTVGAMTITVSGAGVRTNIWAGDTVNVMDSAYTGTGLDGVVATQNSTDNVNIGYNGEATLIGNGGTTNFTGSYATQYVQTAVEYVYSIAGITHDVVYANNEKLYISSSDQTTVVGNHDAISGSAGDDFAVYGDYDPVSGNDLDVDYYGNNYTGDNVSGSGDEYGDEGGDDGGDGDYGGYYGYALTAAAAAAKTSGTNIGAIAANDLSMNDRIGAVGSQTARLQANAALAGSVGSGAVLEGPKWDSKVITWSLATDLGSANVPFTGTIGQQYEATIENAFAQWATASGLTFKEVSDSTSADIRLGWSSFDPTTSGVLGYTALKAKAGVAQADTLIGLENPTEDALVTDSNGQLAYSGTQTELSQLVLHEIGHALGLADDSDVNSIMYPTLSTSNETLDSTDIAGIQSLYAPSTVTSTLGDVLAAAGSALSATSLTDWSSFQSSASTLIDSMATFDPTPLSASQSPTLAQVAAVATVPPAWLAAQVGH